MGRGRAVARVADFIELANLVARLGSQERPTAPATCKHNYAACVKPMTPQDAGSAPLLAGLPQDLEA